MKKCLLLVVVGLLALASGCSHVLVHPHAEQVKSVAVVSAYMNRGAYNMDAPHKGEGDSLGALVKTAAKAAVNTAIESTVGDIQGYQPVVASGLKVFCDNLNIPGHWDVVPPTEVVGHEKYKEFLALGEEGATGELMKVAAKLSDADYVSVEGMSIIPMASVVEKGNVRHYGSESSHQKMRRLLGELAVSLDVDAVVILEMDAAYEPKALNLPIGMKRATPNVSIAAVMIDRKGNVAMKTPLVTRGQGDRYEGETTKMLRNDEVQFQEDEAQSAYNATFIQAVEALREQIIEEFSKIAPPAEQAEITASTTPSEETQEALPKAELTGESELASTPSENEASQIE